MKRLSIKDIGTILAAWSRLPEKNQNRLFKKLSHHEAEELFLHLPAIDRARIILKMPLLERRSWIRCLAPDDAADVIQELPNHEKSSTLDLLDDATRNEVMALLAYAEDQAGGLMNPRFLRLRPDMTVDQAIRYLRVQTKSLSDSVYYAYVLDVESHLLGVTPIRDLFLAPDDKTVQEIMNRDFMSVPEDMDQEVLGRLFSQGNWVALPVVDKCGHMKGVVNINDIVKAVNTEATEDIQKIGAVSVLELPYLQMNFFHMIYKRAGWLIILFVSEMFTATAMAYFEDEIARAVVLALFIPLIISSGGNSGSQASSLIIRSLALGEVRLGDWWRVFSREVATGFALGAILGCIGFVRILAWPTRATLYGEHYILVASTVALSLVGVVLWGSLMGSMLPFILRAAKLDPATASAPMVATLVDVTGIAIYFTIASLVLSGTLL